MHLYIKSVILLNLMLNVYCIFPEFPDLQEIIKILPDTNLNSQCKDDLQRYLTEASNFTYWALQMYDATGKQPSGIFDGNIYSLGHFDQCLKVKSPDRKIEGQYCLAKFQIETNTHPWKEYHDEITIYRAGYENDLHRKGPFGFMSTTFHQWGLCIPSSCSHVEIQEALQNLSAIWSPIIYIKMIISKDACTIAKKPFQLTIWEFILLLPMMVLIVLVIYSSFKYSKEINSKSHQDKWQRVLQCFAIQSNFNELFKFPAESFGFLDGIRVFSICGIIITHRLIIFGQLAVLNKYSFVEKQFSIYNLWFVNTSLFVDTFFVIGGFLRALGISKQFERKGNYAFWIEMKQRYLRITPTYAMVLVLHSVLMPNTGSGPFWDTIWQKEIKNCKQSWFYNLLYLNNFINYDNFCMLHSWYLSIDMHYFLLAPFFLYPLMKWSNRSRTIFISGVLLLGLLLPLSITYWLQLPGMSFFKSTDYKLYQFFKTVYMNSFCRTFSYVLGLIFGYWFYYNKKTQINIPKPFIALGWIIGLAFINIAMLSPYRFIQMDYQYDKLENALFSSLHRAVWSFGIVWLIFACHYGFGGPICKLLSANIWKPISRISFCIYLIHLSVLLFFTARLRHSAYVDEIEMVHYFSGDLTIIILVGLLFYLIVEAPLSKIITVFVTSKGPEKVLKKNPDESPMDKNTKSMADKKE